MTRYLYGGNIGDFGVAVRGGLLIPASGATVTGWTAQTGGTQITDFTDLSNTPITSVAMNSYGYFNSQFMGPDDAGPFAAYAGAWWADAGTGQRVLITTTDPNFVANAYGCELARAVNRFTTAVALTPGSATVPPTIGLCITVPPTVRPITLEWTGYISITAAGNGCVGFGVVEMTTNTAVDRGATTIPGGFLTGTFSSLLTIKGSSPQPASTIWRTFRLSGLLFRDTSSALAASMQASNGDGTDSRNTWLRAVQA